MVSDFAEMNRLNESLKAQREVEKHTLREEDLGFQRKFTEQLESQEAARARLLTRIKEKQELMQRRFEAGASGGRLPTKLRFVPDTLIERNQAEIEKKEVLKDEKRKTAALDRTADMKRVLAMQLQEREARRKAALAERPTIHTRNMEEQLALERDLAAKHEADKLKKLQIKSTLEDQMRANSTAVKNLSMTTTERKINHHLLTEAGLS